MASRIIQRICFPALPAIVVAMLALPAGGGAAVRPITECNDAGVRQAVAAGGEYAFQCDAQVAIELAAPLTITSSTSLDASGHEVFLNNPRGRAFYVQSGTLRLIDVGVRGSIVGNSGAKGSNRGDGGPGWAGDPLQCAPQNEGHEAESGGSGGAGANGGDGTEGDTVRGGGIFVASGASVQVYGGQVLGYLRGGDGGPGGNGGDGGAGGAGGNMEGACDSTQRGGSGGPGGDGGNGGNGGRGGDAEGGAVYVDQGGSFSAVGTSFYGAHALGGDGGEAGNGGSGGWRGDGGIGGGCCPGSDGSPGDYSGSGGEGGWGGPGGDGKGGAIFSRGTLALWSVGFGSSPPRGEEVSVTGGRGGNGGQGGRGGSGRDVSEAPVGDGGDGGSGGPGGAAEGGGIYSLGSFSLSEATFYGSSAGLATSANAATASGGGGDGGAGGESPVAVSDPEPGIPGDGGAGGAGGAVDSAVLAGATSAASCVFSYEQFLHASHGGDGGPGGSQGISGGLVGLPGSNGAEGFVGEYESFPGYGSQPCSGVRVNEVMLSSGGDAGAQFVELAGSLDEESPGSGAPFELVVYDAAGARTGGQTIATPLLGNLAEPKTLLLSTPAADAAFGATGDAPLSLHLPPDGQACFTRGVDEERLSCVAWGCVAKPVAPGTTLIASPPDGQSAQLLSPADYWMGEPTPGADNRYDEPGPPRCPVIDSEALDEESPAPTGSGPGQAAPAAPTPKGAAKAAGAGRRNCLAQAQRDRKAATAKVKGRDAKARRSALRKIARKYRLAVERCRSGS